MYRKGEELCDSYVSPLDTTRNRRNFLRQNNNIWRSLYIIKEITTEQLNQCFGSGLALSLLPGSRSRILTFTENNGYITKLPFHDIKNGYFLNFFSLNNSLFDIIIVKDPHWNMKHLYIDPHWDMQHLCIDPNWKMKHLYIDPHWDMKHLCKDPHEIWSIWV